MIDWYINQKQIESFSQDKKSYLLDYKDFDISNSISLPKDELISFGIKSCLLSKKDTIQDIKASNPFKN